jgi:Fe-S cluster biogenesis protein NfuA
VSPEPARLPPEVTAAMYRLDDLVRTFEEHPDPRVQDSLVEVLRAVDVLHRGGLQRLSALLDVHGIRDDAFADPHIALLFGLYGDSCDEDDDEQSRVEAVVADVRPYVEAHGGRLEVVRVEDGVVNVQLLGGCESCSGSAAELRTYVEEALRSGLPDFVRMDLASPQPNPATSARPATVLIPLSVLAPNAPRDEPSGGCRSGRGCGGAHRGCPGCG